jgi:hypothetical protein
LSDLAEPRQWAKINTAEGLWIRKRNRRNRHGQVP